MIIIEFFDINKLFTGGIKPISRLTLSVHNKKISLITKQFVDRIQLMISFTKPISELDLSVQQRIDGLYQSLRRKIAADITECITKISDHQNHCFSSKSFFFIISMLLYGIPLKNMILKSELI